MANRMFMDQLIRLTLVQKGATAKHPALRKGVVEAVKATVPEETPNAEHEGQESQEGQETGETSQVDWYSDFETFITTLAPDTRAGSWEESFSTAYAEKAAKKPNYPSSRGPFAGPHNSFPIKTQQDVYDAARLIGHAQNPAAVKQAIIRIAHSKGFSLPKSWQSKATKSVTTPLELAQQLAAALATAPEPPAQDPATPVEKARVSQVAHAHSHQHTSQMGYGYSHTHAHPHPSAAMQDHDTSETAHAHEHAAKAEDEETVNLDEITANQLGLQADLVALKATMTQLTQTLESVVAAREAAEKAIDDKVAAAIASVTATVAQHEEKLAAVTDASRRPLTVPTNLGAPKVEKNTPFDEAFSRLLHS
jgi:hypothetical protein